MHKFATKTSKVMSDVRAPSSVHRSSLQPFIKGNDAIYVKKYNFSFQTKKREKSTTDNCHEQKFAEHCSGFKVTCKCLFIEKHNILL